MANGCLGYGDLVGAADVTSSGTVGNMTVDRVKDGPIGEVCRLDTSSGGTITVVQDVPTPARLFAVAIPDAMVTDQFLLQVSSTADPSLGDIVNEVLPPVNPRRCRTFKLLSETVTNYRSLRITCNCTFAPMIGRIWCGPVFQPDYNFALGYSEGVISNSINANAARSIARKKDRRPSQPYYEFQHDWLGEADAAIARLAMITSDTTEQCVWIPDPDDLTDALEKLCIGALTEIQPVTLQQNLWVGDSARPVVTKRWKIVEDT